MTIKEIAAMANVSISMVSRVINNQPGVSEKNRLLIEHLLKKYDYMPNEAARGLACKETRAIGILVTDIREPHHTKSAYAIQLRLAEKNYSSIIFNTGTDRENRLNCIKKLKQRLVDGVIIIGSSMQVDYIGEAIQRDLKDIPVVMCNGEFQLSNVYSVFLDEYLGTLNCTEYLLSEGRKNIVFIYSGRDTPGNQKKKKAFINIIKNTQNNNNKDPIVYKCDYDLESGYNITKCILTEHPETDALIFTFDLEATGGIRALSDLKISIPDQISVISLDRSVYCDICNPRLTALDSKVENMGYAAAELMISILAGEKPLRKIMIPSEVVFSESTKKVN